VTSPWRRRLATVQQGTAQLTDEQIAAVLNHREGTNRNTRKSVSFHRCMAEKKLRRGLHELYQLLRGETE
jgi:hypothetical protein